MMRHRSSAMRTPIWFKLFFGFVVAAVLAVWSVVIFAGYTVITDPESVGRQVGRFVGGISKGIEDR